MEAGKKQNLLKQSKLMHTDKLSFDVKISKLSFLKKQYQPLIESISLIIDYLQLFSQAFILNGYLYDTSSQNFNSLFTHITPMAKIFNPGYLVPFIDSKAATLLVYSCLTLYLLLKYTILVYVVVIAVKDIDGNPVILSIWKWIFKLHGRILYFFITSFWTSLAVITLREGYSPFRFNSIGVAIFSIAVVILEYLFSLGIYLRYEFLLPTKSFLSSKNNLGEMIILTQKFILQMFEIILLPNKLQDCLIATCVSLALGLFHIHHHFSSLPLYNLKALILEGCLLSQTTWLNFVFLLRLIISSTSPRRVTMDYAMILWLALSPLTVKGTMTYLNRVMTNLVITRSNGSSKFLIHKVYAVRQIRGEQRPATDFTRNYDMPHLVYETCRSSPKNIFDLEQKKTSATKSSLDISSLDISSKVESNRIFLAYLELLMSRFSRDNLVRLYIAYYYGKKFMQYETAIKILFTIQNSSSAKMALNAALLINDIQTKLKSQYENTSSKVDFSTYIKSLGAVNSLKDDIMDQVDMQIKICKEFVADVPDLEKIFVASQEVEVLRQKVEVKTKTVLDRLPDSNIEPYMLLARYHLVMNHSLIDYTKNSKTYSQRYNRYAKLLNDDHICPENLHDRNNAFIMITAQSGNAGMIVYSSKAAEDIFGANLVGMQAFSMLPPILQNFYYEFFKNPLDPANKDYIGHMVRTFAYHKEGYVNQIEFYMNIHPSLSQGLYYNMLIRPVHSSSEYIILSDGGTIETFTQDIGLQLGLVSAREAKTSGGISVEAISQQLYKVNQAYNMVLQADGGKQHEANLKSNFGISEQTQHIPSEARTPKEREDSVSGMTLSQARLIYSLFNDKGRNLSFLPLKRKMIDESEDPRFDGAFHFNCKVQNKSFGATSIRVVTLAEAVDLFLDDEDEEEELNEINFLFKKLTAVRQRDDSRGQSPKTTFLLPYKREIIEAPSEDPTLQLSHNSRDIERFESGKYSIEKKSSVRPSKNTLDRRKSTLPEEQVPPSIENSAVPPTPQRVDKDPRVTYLKKHRVKDQNTLSRLKRMKGVLDDDWDQDDQNAIAKLQVVQQSMGSQKSRSSAQGRVSRALKEALSIPYYPKYFNFFIVGFYTLLILTFVSQLYFKLIIDDDLVIRKARKDVIRNAESRNDMLVGIQRQLHYAWDLHSGRLQEKDLGLFAQSVSSFLTTLTGNIKSLAAINNNLIQATNSLRKEYRTKLFTTNVRIFETDFSDPVQVWMNLTNFQATERIIETGYKGFALGQTSMDQAKPYFTFLFRNTLNDLLLVSEDISRIFVQALNDDQKLMLSSFSGSLLASLLVLGIAIAVSCWVIASQYEAEKKNMYAFLKLSSTRVKELTARFMKFKRVLQEDASLEESQTADFSQYAARFAKAKGDSKKANRVTIQHLNHKGIFRKYAIYVLRVIILVAVLAGFITLNYVSSRDSFVQIHNNLHQLYFSDRMRSRLNLALIVSQELLTSVNTTLIRNQPATTLITQVIEDVKIINGEIPFAFQNVDSSMDSIVQEIVFEDGCVFMTGFQAQGCLAVTKGGGKVSLLVAATTVEGGITERYNRFVASNKSDAALAAIQSGTINVSVTPNIVLAAENTLISSILNKNYESYLTTTKKQTQVYWILFCMALIAVCVVSWYIFVKKLREADGQFKRVLHIFPPNLVLSNFMLKSYLLKNF